MLRHMLVRLEETAEASVATKYVLQLAAGYRATVTGLVVRPPPPLELPPDAAGVSVAALATAQVPVGPHREWESEQMAAQARLVGPFEAAAIGAEVTTRLDVRTGWAVEEIAAASRIADLVAIGRNPSEGGRIGSLLERLVRLVPHPFLVAGETAGFRRIAIAYDGSVGAARALKTAADLVGRWTRAKPEVTVIEVTPHGSASTGALNEARAYLEIYGIPCRGLLVQGPPIALADVAAEQDVDLLCMGAYGHWVLRDILLGSTTQALVELRTKPILLCH